MDKPDGVSIIRIGGAYETLDGERFMHLADAERHAKELARIDEMVWADIRRGRGTSPPLPNDG